ncbi:MAG: ferrochelatase, partial [Mycobacteriales bacterium]
MASTQSAHSRGCAPVMLDALLLVSFGGPQAPDEVMPFLRNVTRGRGVPDTRLEEVAEHYHRFGGASPINDQNRALLAAIGADFARHGMSTPLYWGNRNWHPYLADTVAQLRDDGVRTAGAFVTSAYGGYSACRQYLENIERARRMVGPGAPQIVKLPQYAQHEGFLAPHADALARQLDAIPAERLVTTRVLFCAHSIPTAANERGGPTGGLYARQLRATAGLVAQRAAHLLSATMLPWDLVWQSRSGAPSTPWLEPDISDRLAELAAESVTDVVVSPIGFVSDHVEVLWDLDNEAADTAKELGLGYSRAVTPGTDPRFVAMVRE